MGHYMTEKWWQDTVEVHVGDFTRLVYRKSFWLLDHLYVLY